MSITFRCEHCHREVTAPDGVGGKRGKCPFCSKSTYIPVPVDEDDVLPLAPIDADAERRLEAEEKALREQDLALLDTSGEGASGPPLDQREDLTPEDLQHFAINYCLDMANSNLERAGTYAAKLNQFGSLGRQAVDDLLADEILDPALASLPEPLVRGFLKQLSEDLK